MVRMFALIAVFFVLSAAVLYATDRVRRYGVGILGVALGAVTTLICTPFALILGLMYATGSPGEQAYALRELHGLWPFAVAGVVILAISLFAVKRRAQI